MGKVSSCADLCVTCAQGNTFLLQFTRPPRRHREKRTSPETIKAVAKTGGRETRQVNSMPMPKCLPSQENQSKTSCRKDLSLTWCLLLTPPFIWTARLLEILFHTHCVSFFVTYLFISQLTAIWPPTPPTQRSLGKTPKDPPVAKAQGPVYLYFGWPSLAGWLCWPRSALWNNFNPWFPFLPLWLLFPSLSYCPFVIHCEPTCTLLVRFTHSHLLAGQW